MKLINFTIIFIFLLTYPIYSEDDSLKIKADYLYEIGDFYEASKIYERIIALNPDDKYNFLNLIDSLYQFGDFKRGEIYTKKFLEKFKKSSEFYYLLGIEEGKRGFLKKGIFYFKKSIKIDGSNYKSMVEMAIFFIKLGEYENCFKIIEKLKKNRDNLSEILYILALFYRYEGNYKMADIWFQTAIITSPNDIFVNGEYYRNSLALGKNIDGKFYFRMNEKFYIKYVIDTIYNSILVGKNFNRYLKILEKIERYRHAVLPLKILLLIKMGREDKAIDIYNSIPKNYKKINLINLSSGILKFKTDKKLGRKLIKKAFAPSYYLNDPNLYLKILKKFSERIDKNLVEEIKEKVKKIKTSSSIFSPTDILK